MFTPQPTNTPQNVKHSQLHLEASLESDPPARPGLARLLAPACLCDYSPWLHMNLGSPDLVHKWTKIEAETKTGGRCCLLGVPMWAGYLLMNSGWCHLQHPQRPLAAAFSRLGPQAQQSCPLAAPSPEKGLVQMHLFCPVIDLGLNSQQNSFLGFGSACNGRVRPEACCFPGDTVTIPVPLSLSSPSSLSCLILRVFWEVGWPFRGGRQCRLRELWLCFFGETGMDSYPDSMGVAYLCSPIAWP